MSYYQKYLKYKKKYIVLHNKLGGGNYLLGPGIILEVPETFIEKISRQPCERKQYTTSDPQTIYNLLHSKIHRMKISHDYNEKTNEYFYLREPTTKPEEINLDELDIEDDSQGKYNLHYNDPKNPDDSQGKYNLHYNDPENPDDSNFITEIDQEHYKKLIKLFNGNRNISLLINIYELDGKYYMKIVTNDIKE